MNILEFIKEFPTEDSCKQHFIDLRKEQGVVCKKCGSSSHYWLRHKEQFECKNCKFRTTLRSGTILQSSKLPYSYWYMAMHLMTSTKKGFSAHEMRRQLGHKRYEPIWYMMKKIRACMGDRERSSQLVGMVEFDDAYVSTFTSQRQRSSLKRGKGSSKKSKVAVMAESFPLEHKGKESKYCGQLKMEFNSSEKQAATKQIAKLNIQSDNIVFSDKASSYVGLKDIFSQNIQWTV